MPAGGDLRRPALIGWRSGPLAPGSAVTALRAAVPPWLVAHTLVLAGLTYVAWWGGGLPVTGTAPDAQGLLAWDGGWYRAIADVGYTDLPAESVRFFPLLPMATAAVSWLTGLPTGVALTGICWLAALGFGALVAELTRRELGDRATGRRAAWLVQLAPGASVLVLGYTEAPAGLLAVAFFMLLRAGRWAALIPVGLASGLVRPTGLLLVVPAVVCLWDRRATIGWRLAGALAPLAGVGLYLAWSAVTFGSALLPFSTQTGQSLRGGVAQNPLPYLLHGSDVGTPRPLALVLLVAAAALLVVTFRRLPLPYGLWAVCLVAAAVTAHAMSSLPRYLAGIFPLAMAAATVLRSRLALVATLTACAVGFTALAVAGFTTHYVP